MSEIQERPYSRPVFERTIFLQTETAQRVMEREFARVENALYSLEVILRIIGKPEAVDLIESSVNQLLSECLRLIGEEQDRFRKLMEDHGIGETPSYTQAREIKVLISSPQVGQFLSLVQQLDQLISSLDALWLLGVMSNQQRADGAYRWQQTVLQLGRQIADLQRRGGQAASRERELQQRIRESSGGEA